MITMSPKGTTLFPQRQTVQSSVLADLPTGRYLFTSRAAAATQAHRKNAWRLMIAVQPTRPALLAALNKLRPIFRRYQVDYEALLIQDEEEAGYCAGTQLLQSASHFYEDSHINPSGKEIVVMMPVDQHTGQFTKNPQEWKEFILQCWQAIAREPAVGYIGATPDVRAVPTAGFLSPFSYAPCPQVASSASQSQSNGSGATLVDPLAGMTLTEQDLQNYPEINLGQLRVNRCNGLRELARECVSVSQDYIALVKQRVNNNAVKLLASKQEQSELLSLNEVIAYEWQTQQQAWLAHCAHQGRGGLENPTSKFEKFYLAETVNEGPLQKNALFSAMDYFYKKATTNAAGDAMAMLTRAVSALPHPGDEDFQEPLKQLLQKFLEPTYFTLVHTLSCHATAESWLAAYCDSALHGDLNPITLTLTEDEIAQAMELCYLLVMSYPSYAQLFYRQLHHFQNVLTQFSQVVAPVADVQQQNDTLSLLTDEVVLSFRQ